MTFGPKLKEYLAAAAKIGRRQGQIFDLEEVGRLLQWERIECERVTSRLEKEGLLNRLPDGEAILTTAGTKFAEEI
jgi:Mn-dependent DtxR family transcriptional regulator